MTDSRKTKIGWFLVVAPIPLLVVTIATYAIIAFIVAQSLDANSDLAFGHAAQLALGFGGLLGVLGIFVGMPIGIYFLASRTPKDLVLDPAAQTPNAIEYRSAAAFAKTTIGLLVAFTIAASIDVVAQSAILGYIATFSLAETIPSFRLAYNLHYANDVAGLLFLTTGMFYFAWKYRAYRNLHVIRTGELKYSHTWAVGGYFVPFANIVVPFRVMREIIRESKATIAVEFLMTWWIAFLVAQIAIELTPTDLETFVVPLAAWKAIGSLLWDVGMIISAISLMIIVGTVTTHQDRHFAQ